MVHVRFDLLTPFRQGNRGIDEWYNAVQAHIPLCEYPTETATILGSLCQTLNLSPTQSMNEMQT